MKKSRLKPISEKKRRQIIEELPIRKALCERVGGVWITSSGGFCVGGYCDECGKLPDFRGLHPHHSGIGSKREPLSMKDKMLCGRCHSLIHGVVEK